MSYSPIRLTRPTQYEASKALVKLSPSISTKKSRSGITEDQYALQSICSCRLRICSCDIFDCIRRGGCWQGDPARCENIYLSDAGRLRRVPKSRYREEESAGCRGRR